MRLRVATVTAWAAWAAGCSSPGAPPPAAVPPEAAVSRQPAPHEVVVPAVEPTPPVRSVADVERDLGLAPGALTTAAPLREFRIDAGDAVSIQVRSHPQFSQEVAVAPDGRVTVARLGSLKAQGMTFPELESALQALCVDIGLKNPVVAVSLKAPAKRFVTIIGLSAAAGVGLSTRHEIQGSGTLLETLAAAGWIPGNRRTRRLHLTREGRSTVVDLTDITRQSSMAMNIELRPNDMLITFDYPPFLIRGQMNLAGPSPIPDKGWVSVEEAIVLGTGVKPDADVEKAQIVRTTGQVERVNLNHYLYGRRGSEIRIYPGDEFFVPATREIGVYVFGMVPAPGLHRRQGRVTFSQAMAMAGIDKFGAVSSDIRLIRGYPSNPQVIGMNFDALAKGDAAHEMDLQDGDVLYVAETTLSDVLDVVARVLGPLSGSLGTATQVMTMQRLSAQ